MVGISRKVLEKGRRGTSLVAAITVSGRHALLVGYQPDEVLSTLSFPLLLLLLPFDVSRCCYTVRWNERGRKGGRGERVEGGREFMLYVNSVCRIDPGTTDASRLFYTNFLSFEKKVIVIPCNVQHRF